MPHGDKKNSGDDGGSGALLPADIAAVSAAIAQHAALPVNKDTIMSFPQGWDCMLKAFERLEVLTAAERLDAVAVLVALGLREAFTYRRELINFKKLMLHVSQRATDR
jgi:hypothetical protein